MDSTEIMQKIHSTSPTSPGTPPDTPPDLPASYSCAHQFVAMVKSIVSLQMAQTGQTQNCNCTCSDASRKNPNSPGLSPPSQGVQAKDSAGGTDGAKSAAKPEDVQPTAARASKLEFKKVNEVWSIREFRYKIEDPPIDTQINELDQYVFIVRVRIDKKTTEPSFFIDVKSEALRDIFREVLKGVRISLGEDKPTVEQNLLYHYLPELESYRSTLGECLAEPLAEPTRMKHLDILLDYLKSAYQSTTATLVALLERKEITYDLLWALFKPNSLVYTTCFGTGKPRCVKYDSGDEKDTREGEIYWNMACRYLDFNNDVFGEASITIRIPHFHGTKRINALKAFPLQYHRDEKRARVELVRCGRKFVSLRGTHHRRCHGPAFYVENGTPVQKSINGRIMIDATFFQEIKPNTGSRPRVTEAVGMESVMRSSDQWQLSRGISTCHSSSEGKPIGIEPVELEDDELLICCPTVPGFSLSDKLWVEFAVSGIEDIEWSSLPFDCLTISDEQREVIVALAEAHTIRVPGATFDDFVEGKGRGLNVLLHGPPGVGKTLTAEAVSEHLKRPLYSISAGELRTSASEMESQLSQIFQIARHWNAILLLDEADVFLERRSSHDLIRNSLVSVFLRKLEYCEGIMFLTTNRVAEFDEAILTRIHLMLRYEELDLAARTMIWGHFLKRACTTQGPAEIKPEELKRLVTGKFNGRQIKNIVATAHALATRRKSIVLVSHLREAVTASEKFIREFNGGDDAARMFM